MNWLLKKINLFGTLFLSDEIFGCLNVNRSNTLFATCIDNFMLRSSRLLVGEKLEISLEKLRLMNDA